MLLDLILIACSCTKHTKGLTIWLVCRERLWGIVEQQVHHLVHLNHRSAGMLSSLTPHQVDDLLYEVTEVSTASHFSQKTVNTWPFLHIYTPPTPHPSNNVYGGEVYWNHSVCS